MLGPALPPGAQPPPATEHLTPGTAEGRGQSLEYPVFFPKILNFHPAFPASSEERASAALCLFQGVFPGRSATHLAARGKPGKRMSHPGWSPWRAGKAAEDLLPRSPQLLPGCAKGQHKSVPHGDSLTILGSISMTRIQPEGGRDVHVPLGCHLVLVARGARWKAGEILLRALAPHKSG